jgi:hypothetical protein
MIAFPPHFITAFRISFIDRPLITRLARLVCHSLPAARLPSPSVPLFGFRDGVCVCVCVCVCILWVWEAIGAERNGGGGGGGGGDGGGVDHDDDLDLEIQRLASINTGNLSDHWPKCCGVLNYVPLFCCL